VRENRYTTAAVPFSNFRLYDRHTPAPILDSEGKVTSLRIPAGPIRTAQGRTFKIWVKTRLARLRLGRRAAALWYTTLPRLGIGSWILYSRFEVCCGKLEESRTTAGEDKHGRSGSGSYSGRIPFAYEVVSTAHSDPSYEYTVGFPRVTHPFECPPGAGCTNAGRLSCAALKVNIKGAHHGGRRPDNLPWRRKFVEPTATMLVERPK
jgi:hypothetical protein